MASIPGLPGGTRTHIHTSFTGIALGGSPQKPLTVSTASTASGSLVAVCENSGGLLSWFLCPVYNDTAAATTWVLNNLIKPLLAVTPVSTSSTDPRYQIWSEFRVLGNVFLVIALLVVVFGESIGGGLIDAYTAKKMLPRILIAAILINLSIYIVAGLVDITNILGAGVSSLIAQPVISAGQTHFQLTLSQNTAVALVGVTGVGILAGTVASGAALATLGAALPFILLFIIMPAAFAVVAAFFTIVIRQALIIFLIFISPVAFALYCLPNTEQYFKRWWDLLFKTLLVYPIIMVIFAVADLTSYIMESLGTLGGGGGAAGGTEVAISTIVGFVALFLPLVFIPYSFRLAGGAIGNVHEMLTNGHKMLQEGIKGNVNDLNSNRNRAKRHFLSQINRNQAQMLHQAYNQPNPSGAASPAFKW